MANFHALERLVDRAVCTAFSERLKFVPQKNNGSRTDSSRASLDINAVLHFPDAKGEVSLNLGGSGRTNVSETKVTGVDAALVIEKQRYPNIKILKNDVFSAQELDEKPWFKVEHVDSTSSGIIIVHLLEDASGSSV